jgi:hypothetical protein
MSPYGVNELSRYTIRARSVASIRSILKNGLDSAFLKEDPEQLPLQHPNIRGRGYYH